MDKKQITIPCTGYSIAADWYEGADPTKILLVLVGYSSTKERNADLTVAIASKANTNALVIDLSGHGESPFELDATRPAQHLLEAVAAFDWLRNAYPEATISVMGTSYGGFLAAFLTRFRDFEKLVLRTPAIYRPEDLYSVHADIDKELTGKGYRKDGDAVAKHPLFMQDALFKGPTLLVVHSEDEVVPTETTDVFEKAFSAETYIAEGFRHAFRDPANPQEKLVEYQNTIANWLKAPTTRN